MPRIATGRAIIHPNTGEVLDNALTLWFPGPNSYTGEDLVELHVHGGTSVISGVLEALGSIECFRHAEHGEFTRRAFGNEKLDLTEIEGLADLLNAETEAQRRQALRQAQGGLKNLYESWRKQLIKNMALVEAIIDFGEDENIEDDVFDQVTNQIKQLIIEISEHMNDNRKGEILRDGIFVTVLGPPNAGKSSFLNYLAQRQAAIVSPIPGTTRDVIEVSLNIGGYPIVIGDTAGLRQTDDLIEIEGISRAKKWCLSCETGEGFKEFLDEFVNLLKTKYDSSTSQVALITQTRHRENLKDCLNFLKNSLDQCDIVLAAEELRYATNALGKITGHVDIEEILDVIFKQFCIGK
ncbi:10439_t:CDS:2 [Entrophospora sp. SA101]|nr:10439_t:CDS:2 [Entrophospora sp. SA101]CAJ0847190.1 14765_t:CDS:2 [Entrophospora sp. SA101]